MKKVVVIISLLALGSGFQLKAIQDVQSVAEFDSMVQQNPVVVAMLGSRMCPHCNAMMPTFNQVGRENPTVKTIFVEINDPKFSIIASRYPFQNMPTFVVIKNGQSVGMVHTVPSKAKAALNTLINK